VEEFLEDIKKKFGKNGKKEKEQSNRIKENFCDKKENQRNKLPKKQTVRKTGRSKFWKI